MLRRYQKRSKKRISTSNFETSSHENVTAKKPIGNMYFMYVDMTWLHSLSRLEHDMLLSTVWPMHKICPTPVCWLPNPTCTKRMLFFAYPSWNAIWFLLKKLPGVVTEWQYHWVRKRVGDGGVLPYLGMVGRFCGDDHHFWDFQSEWVPIIYLHIIWLTPSFCRKNQFVSITFSSKDTRT